LLYQEYCLLKISEQKVMEVFGKKMEGGRKSVGKKRMAICEFCRNLIAVGEGDFICCECEEPVVVISSYSSTKDYLKCSGRKFEN